MVSTEEMKRRLREKREKGVVGSSTPPRKEVEEDLGAVKYCPNCGREYESKANFCEECGTKLEEKPLEAEVSGEYKDFIVVSSNYIPGYRVVETIGFVYGLTVKSRGLGGRLGAGIRSLVGGEITEYVNMMENARQEAINRMIDHARELGADAIISARFDSDSIADVMQEILAYGTAVIVEKE